jgi:hypothetical protein
MIAIQIANSTTLKTPYASTVRNVRRPIALGRLLGLITAPPEAFSEP